MRLSGMFISGLGVYLPSTLVSVESAVEQGLYEELEVELHQLGGAAVAGDVPAPEMALSAARDAFKSCGRHPSEVDLLLYASTWHSGPEGWLPHSYLQRHLVGGDVPATGIRQGCNGMFSALELAASYLLAVPERQAALLVASDNYGTPMMDRWHISSGYVGGDAATALVLSKEQGFAQVLSVHSATVAEAEVLHRGATPLFPPSITVGDGVNFGARSSEARRKAAVRPTGGKPSPGMIAMAKVQERQPEVVQQALDEAGVTIGDITRVAYMSCSREIVEQRCMVPLGLPMEKSTWDYGRTIGHCGASDQLLALDHLLSTGELQPGDHLLMLANGPGVVISAAVVKILDTPPQHA
ncbi:ketoacyl-ACP synthase III family protein [Streptomyces odontomachi]|uniref:ketoacyl-ACP synthase III family protein n=1 Tax=Streptomyces odontomachi TaxID=2944940 RepID=UPI00210DBB9E|nr:ketoacyl-ACP synthase III family protein [Streptomyces sp. ODS25]